MSCEPCNIEKEWRVLRELVAHWKAIAEQLREELAVYRKDDLDATPLAEAVVRLEAENERLRRAIQLEMEGCNVSEGCADCVVAGHCNLWRVLRLAGADD